MRYVRDAVCGAMRRGVPLQAARYSDRRTFAYKYLRMPGGASREIASSREETLRERAFREGDLFEMRQSSRAAPAVGKTAFPPRNTPRIDT